jgi:hypothetical protein
VSINQIIAPYGRSAKADYFRVRRFDLSAFSSKQLSVKMLFIAWAARDEDIASPGGTMASKKTKKGKGLMKGKRLEAQKPLRNRTHAISFSRYS